jgi:hypothetical protein
MRPASIQDAEAKESLQLSLPARGRSQVLTEAIPHAVKVLQMIANSLTLALQLPTS